MTASQLIKRARSLADVPNSLFVTHDDEVNSLSESWKDIYAKITDSSDDYFITEVILDTSTATKLGDNEWELTMPSDVYKIRFVDWKNSGRWENMTKFNTNNRNKIYGQPQYRFRGAKLWLIGNSLPAQIRIDYYPPPIKPTVPENSWEYFLTTPPYTVSANVASPQYFSVPNQNLTDNTDYLLYIYGGTSIRLESAMLATSSTLYTSTGLTNVLYHTGYIYWLEGTDLCRSSTELTGTLTKVVLVSSVQNFNISGENLYYYNGTNTFKANLDGTSPSVFITGFSKYVTIIGADTYYLNTTIFKNSVSTGTAAVSITTDGVELFYLTALGVLYKDVDIFATGLLYAGQIQDNFISIIDSKWNINAISVFTDTDFVYPVNEANEIMSYQCAIDFRRKQNGDITLLAARISEIENRLLSVLMRDAYQPERRSPESYGSYWN
jgi:hypothetical protein